MVIIKNLIFDYKTDKEPRHIPNNRYTNYLRCTKQKEGERRKNRIHII